MKDDRGPLNAAYISGLITGLAFALFLVFLAMPFRMEAYCSTDESSASCFREWAYTVAGWLSVIAAAGAAYFMYRTIQKTTEQLVELKQQTAFMLGNELPSLEIRTTRGRFIVVNWNRRTFYLTGFRWIADDVIQPKVVRLKTPKSKETLVAELAENGRMFSIAIISGWKNRSEAPDQMAGILPLSFESSGETHLEKRVPKKVTLEVSGYFPDREHRTILLYSTRLLIPANEPRGKID